MNKILISLLLGLAVMYGQQPSSDTLSMTATPPSGVQSLSVSTVGVPGGSTYCYWVVAVFAGGMDAQPKASCTSSSNGTLTGGNYNTINWTLASSATGYWVIRTLGNSFPGTGTVAVNTTVLSATTSTLNDQSNTLHSFTWAPMARANATFTLANTGGFLFPNVIGSTAYNITYFSMLPTAASKPGVLYVIYDSPSATSCSGGGGAGTPSLCLSNGVTWIPMATSVSGGTTTIQTNGVNNSSQNPVNFTNSNVFNGLTLTQTNTAGGIVQLGVTGLLTSGGMSTTGVSAGSYTNTNLTVDAAGRITAAANGSGGAGTVSSFSAGTLSPLFTTSVATATTTPALSFALSNFSADNIFGNFTGGSAAPGTQALPSCAADGSHALTYASHTLGCTAITTGGTGTVTSVSFTGGLISVGTPTSTPAFTVAGTSGGIPYFSGASTWASSGALTANLPVIGGGAGVAPSVGTRSGNTTTFVTTTGSQTSGNCVSIDANGNHVASGGACGAALSGLNTTHIPKATSSSTIADSVLLDVGGVIEAPTGSVNFTTSPHTGPVQTGVAASRPGTCSVGDLYFASDATAGQNFYMCASTNTWTQQLNTGGGGQSVFTGSTASNPSFSATPTFSLADVSIKSPVRVEPGALTANVTAVTFTNKTAGAKFSIAWLQDGTGGRTVAYGGSAANTCVIDPTASITTTQFLEIAADGSTVNGVGCTTNNTGVTGGPETTAPGTPTASNWYTWVDSTNHVLSLKTNNSATVSNTVVPSTCGGSTFVQGVSSAGVLACATPAGSGNVSNVGTPLIHQIAIWQSATTVSGIAVGTTDKPLVGVSSADPTFSKLTLTNPATSATLTLDDTSSLITSGAFALTLSTSGTTNAVFPTGTFSVSDTVASGTAAMGTSAIGANSCATTVTVGVGGIASTDIIAFTPNADISGVTGYGVASTDGLKIYPWPTTGNVNFKVCNGTGSSITPGAVSLNWRVVR